MTDTTTTRKAAPEAEIAAPVVALWKERNPMATVKGEVPYENCAIDIAMDIDTGDQDMVVVGEAKVRLNRALMDQLDRWAGVADVVYGIIGKAYEPGENDTWDVLCAECAVKGYGLILSRKGRKPVTQMDARRLSNVQHDRLRKAIHAATDEGTAGAQHGQVTPDAAWHRRVEEAAQDDAAGLPLVMVHRYTDPPYRSNQVALRHLRDAILAGKVNVRIVGASVLHGAKR